MALKGEEGKRVVLLPLGALALHVRTARRLEIAGLGIRELVPPRMALQCNAPSTVLQTFTSGLLLAKWLQRAGFVQ